MERWFPPAPPPKNPRWVDVSNCLVFFLAVPAFGQATPGPDWKSPSELSIFAPARTSAGKSTGEEPKVEPEKSRPDPKNKSAPKKPLAVPKVDYSIKWNAPVVPWPTEPEPKKLPIPAPKTPTESHAKVAPAPAPVIFEKPSLVEIPALDFTPKPPTKAPTSPPLDLISQHHSPPPVSLMPVLDPLAEGSEKKSTDASKPSNAPKPLPKPASPIVDGKSPRKSSGEDSIWAKVDAKSPYRPLVAIIDESEANRRGKKSAAPAAEPSKLPAPVAQPSPVMETELASPTVEEYPDSYSPWGTDGGQWVLLPAGRLWQVPLAHQREPRTTARLYRMHGETFFESALGGEFGLFRRTFSDQHRDGLQLDVFAASFHRFDSHRRLRATDLRFGIPLTVAIGDLSFKLAYEQTASHDGDLYFQSGRTRVEYYRQEVVFGAAYQIDDPLRMYGQMAYAFATGPANRDQPWRFNFGFEWSNPCPTGWYGQPFAAVDGDWRDEQNFTSNVTIQAGWQWRGRFRNGLRIAGEYYNGRSPFGQFFLQRDQWYGGVVSLDW